MEAHDTKANRTLTLGRVFRTGHLVRRAVNVILQNIIEETHDVFDEVLLG